jgi:eukaryotic-like serine/threonine-protein kinase
VNGDPATPRSDVFSFGVVAWEAIAGRRLFAGSSQAATLTAIVEQTAPALDAVARVDAELSAIVAGALAKEASDRVDAAELADLLAQYAGGSEHAAAADGVARLVNRLFGSRLAARRAVLRVARR